MYTRAPSVPKGDRIQHNDSRIQGDLMKLFAYLDPGTGTLIVQAVLGGAAGVAVLFKTMGNKFKRNKPEETTDALEMDDAGEPTVPAPNAD